MIEHADVLVIGGGQAGHRTVTSLRRERFGGTVALVAAESVVPYQRPPLSKEYLVGTIDAETTHLQKASWYENQRIELITGRCAVELDRTASNVSLDNGQRIGYDHLVLATGARARALPVNGTELAGVAVLRSLRDAQRVRDALTKTPRVVVIGGEFIGLEVAVAAAKRGCDVTILETAPRLMSRLVSKPVSDQFLEAHERHGVRVHLQSQVSRLVGTDGRIQAVETDNGRLFAADFAIIGIGVQPNTDLAERAGLEVDDGIVVDGWLRTDDVSISAIGDCARFPSPHANRQSVRLESVQNAVDQARFVARQIAGSKGAPYFEVPWFWSNQYGLRLQIAGLPDGRDVPYVVHGPGGDTGFSVLSFRDGRLARVESVNRPRDHIAARQLLAEDSMLSPDAVNPDFDLPAHAKQVRETGASPSAG